MKGLRNQMDKLLERGDVTFCKMCDTGDMFKKKYSNGTPATSVVALNNFDTTDVQSVYYDCKNYTANLFRFEDKIFFRSLFLFDDRIEDIYLKDTCKTFDAVYENLPIVDTMTCPEESRKRCGLVIDGAAGPFKAQKAEDSVLEVSFENGSVTFYEDRVEVVAESLLWYKDLPRAAVKIDGDGLSFEYKGHSYRLDIDGAALSETSEGIRIDAVGRKTVLYPRKV